MSNLTDTIDVLERLKGISVSGDIPAGYSVATLRHTCLGVIYDRAGRVKPAQPSAYDPSLTRAQRASDIVNGFCGSWPFIIVFSCITLAWMAWNTVLAAFDPYPYILLNLFLTVISTFQSPLIMMSQNRQVERDKLAAKEQADLDRELVRGLHEKLDSLLKETPNG